jgi:hypothetical protein
VLVCHDQQVNNLLLSSSANNFTHIDNIFIQNSTSFKEMTGISSSWSEICLNSQPGKIKNINLKKKVVMLCINKGKVNIGVNLQR